VCFSSATSFTAGTYSTTANPYFVCNADFNNDGETDLATANYGSNDVSVLLGTGTGSFSTATHFTAGTNPYSICSADFNMDGNADLAVANYNGSNSVSILLGTGTGGFGVA